VKTVDDLKSEISSKNPEAAIFLSKNHIVNLAVLSDFHAKTQSSQSTDKVNAEKPFVFCGLGNPQNFFDQLRQESIVPVGTKTFGDHHTYGAADIETIESAARIVGAASLITTAKDAVKLAGLEFDLPCNVAEVETVIDNAEAFRKLLV
jgi:tetraacyldisaccharide-1-P 4'-kinase